MSAAIDLTAAEAVAKLRAREIDAGEVLYNRFCARCHVFGRGLLPDLRQLPPEIHSIFYDIVLKGAFQPKGMARWDDVLSRTDAEAIHAYLVDQAWQMSGAAESGNRQWSLPATQDVEQYRANRQGGGGDIHDR